MNKDRRYDKWEFEPENPTFCLNIIQININYVHSADDL